MNITDILTEHARNRPDHPAIEDGERIVTYGGLDRLVDGAAANLQAAGIEPGDTVALLLGESGRSSDYSVCPGTGRRHHIFAKLNRFES